jgi:hypothetical protein
MGMARVASRIPSPNGSAAVALEVFTREKIGVEGDTLADAFLGSVLQGRLRSNVSHFRSIGEAVAALKDERVAAVMAPSPSWRRPGGRDTLCGGGGPARRAQPQALGHRHGREGRFR